MSDLTHDTAEDGFHEIQLSGKQLVFLFMATTVVSVVIFLCGVLVGRGVRTERGDNPPVETAAAPAVPAPGAVATAGPPAGEPPVPPEEGDDLSYKKRLESAGTPAEQLKPPAPDPARQRPVAPPVQPAPAAAAPASAGRPGAWVVQVVALQDRNVANTIVRRLTGKGYPAFVVNPSGSSPAAIYRVHVGRYNDRREAEQVARRLEKEEQFKPWISH